MPPSVRHRLLVGSLLLASCAAPGEHSPLHHQVEELRRAVAEKKRSLEAAEAHLRILLGELETIECERDRAVAERSDLELASRHIRQRAGQLEAERGKLLEALDTSEKHYERLSASYENLRHLSEAYSEELDALHREYLALDKAFDEAAAAREKRLASGRLEESAGRGPDGTVHAIYRDDPHGLWKEVTGFVGERLSSVFRGGARWDAVDALVFAAAAAALLALLWLLGTPVRWVTRRRLRRELHMLRRRVRELEEAGTGSAPPTARLRLPRRRRPLREPEESAQETVCEPPVALELQSEPGRPSESMHRAERELPAEPELAFEAEPAVPGLPADREPEPETAPGPEGSGAPSVRRPPQVFPGTASARHRGPPVSPSAVDVEPEAVAHPRFADRPDSSSDPAGGPTTLIRLSQRDREELEDGEETPAKARPTPAPEDLAARGAAGHEATSFPQEESTAETSEERELSGTHVIPDPFPAGADLAAAPSSAPVAPPEKESSPEGESESERGLSATHILPDVHFGEAGAATVEGPSGEGSSSPEAGERRPGAEPPDAAAQRKRSQRKRDPNRKTRGTGNTELLDELKDLIGEQFESLLK